MSLLAVLEKNSRLELSNKFQRICKVIYTWGFPYMGVPLFMDGLFHGRSQSQMGDWG